MSLSLEQLPNLTELSEAELASLVESLLELVQKQKEKIRQLEEEIRELKKLNQRPKLRPSKIDGSVALISFRRGTAIPSGFLGGQ